MCNVHGIMAYRAHYHRYWVKESIHELVKTSKYIPYVSGFQIYRTHVKALYIGCFLLLCRVSDLYSSHRSTHGDHIIQTHTWIDDHSKKSTILHETLIS